MCQLFSEVDSCFFFYETIRKHLGYFRMVLLDDYMFYGSLWLSFKHIVYM